MLEILAPLAIFLAILTVVADRVLHAETFAQWSFGFLFIVFIVGAISFLSDTVVGTAPLEVFESGFIDYMKWVTSKYGGWSPMFAAQYFCLSAAAGVMFLLASLVDAVEAEWYGLGAVGSLLCGILFLVGFFVFFEALALILGIVGTIVGIIVAVIKLRRRNLE